jgi:hypothetical protein
MIFDVISGSLASAAGFLYVNTALPEEDSDYKYPVEAERCEQHSIFYFSDPVSLNRLQESLSP